MRRDNVGRVAIAALECPEAISATISRSRAVNPAADFGDAVEAALIAIVRRAQEGPGSSAAPPIGFSNRRLADFVVYPFRRAPAEARRDAKATAAV